MSNHYPSRTADKFMVRLPDGLRDDMQGAADYLDTSMNTVFIQAVRQYLDGQQRQQLLLDALAAAAAPRMPPLPGDGLEQIIRELRTYTPAADQCNGEHIHKGWARSLESLFLIPLKQADIVGALQLDLTKRDERIDQMEGLLRRWSELFGVSAPGLRDETLLALKPAEAHELCASIGCDKHKADGSLFCAAHQSAKSRTREHYPVTGERLEFMMQNDGYQQ